MGATKLYIMQQCMCMLINLVVSYLRVYIITADPPVLNGFLYISLRTGLINGEIRTSDLDFLSPYSYVNVSRHVRIQISLCILCS